MLAQETVDHSATVARHLPYLRRYARALTGNQSSGDKYAVAVLETIITDRGMLQAQSDPKVAIIESPFDRGDQNRRGFASICISR